jgi:hypothetical protein
LSPIFLASPRIRTRGRNLGDGKPGIFPTCCLASCARTEYTRASLRRHCHMRSPHNTRRT